MTVLLLTIIYTFISTVYSQPKDAICIWGRTTIPGPEANGLYRLGTEQANDAPYWKLDMTGTDCPNKYFWLFWYGDNINDQGWYIGTSGTQDFAFGIDGLLHAKCTNAAAIQTLDPTYCDANWAYFFDYQTTPFDTIDSGVTASEGPCPTLNCASITVTGIGYSGGCSGTFDQTGNQSNHYTQSGSNKIWWFNVLRFQWQCNTGTTNAEQTCNNTRLNIDIVQYAAAQTWQGETGTMTYTGVVCTCGTGSMSIQCITGGGASTTTYLPTTPNPTQGPPTPKPTKVTLVPTINPTTATDTPTAPSAPTAPTMPTGAPSAPTEPTTQAPNTADTVYDPDDKDDNGSGGSMIDGLDDTWLWVIIIILIIILCCCCICCLWFYRKRQKENSNQYFGDNDTGNYQDDQNL
eukprot:205015_1